MTSSCQAAAKRASGAGGDHPVEKGPHARAAVWPAIGLALLTLLVALPNMGGWCILTPDATQFLTVARALWETHRFPAEPSGVPPGLPILIAPLMASGDFPFLGLRILFAGCWALTSSLTYLLHRRYLGKRLACAAGFIVAVSPVLLSTSTVALSEPVFLVLVMAVLLIAEGWWDRRTEESYRRFSGPDLMSVALAMPDEDRGGSAKDSGRDSRGSGCENPDVHRDSHQRFSHQQPLEGNTGLPGGTQATGGRDVRLAACTPRIGGCKPMPPMQIILAGLLAGAAVSVRAIGVVLIPLLMLALLRRREMSRGARLLAVVLFGICALTPAVAWQIHLRGVPRPDSYMQALMGSRLAENTNATGLALQIDRLGKFGPLRVEALKEVVLPRDLGWRAFRPPLSSPSTWLLGGGLLAIAVVRLIRVRRPSDAYLLATLLILAVWPWHEGVRFIVPLIPIVVGYPLWLGLTVWRRRGGRSWERGILLLGLAVFIGLQTGGMVLVQCRLPVQRSKAVQRIATMQQAASWHAEHTPAGSTWLGVTRDLDDRKVLLLGAGYLSRRPVKTIDVQDDRSLMMPLGEESCVFLEESLLNSRADWGGYAVTDHVGPFAVLHPNKPPDLQFP